MRFVCVMCWFFGVAHAESYCVDSSDALESALSAAQNSSENNWIRLKPGTYLTPSGGFVVDVPQGTELTISGGWEDRVAGPVFVPCFSQAHTAWATTIDGRDATVGLSVLLQGDNTFAFIDNLTFAGGWDHSGHGGGLRVNGLPDQIDGAIIHNNVFLNNSAKFGAGVSVWVNTILQFYNNLVFLNDSVIGAAASLTIGESGNAFITNNTVMFNTNTSIDDGSGLRIGGFGAAVLANNLAIDNEGADLVFSAFTEPYLLLHNGYDEVDGAMDPASTGNIVAPDPMFQAGLVNFRLRRDSVLVDAGTTDIFGDISPLDLDNKPRIIGPQIDIGAYENDRLFSVDFEAPSPF